MAQVSAYLRRIERGYAHWCPCCQEMHTIFDVWDFNGDLNKPTFLPSVKTGGKQTIKDARGKWTGEWKRVADGEALDRCCHYFLRAGTLQFLG